MRTPTVIRFAPEHWGQLERFSQLYSETFNFTPFAKRALSGALNHYMKAVTLKNLSIKLIPNLELDEKELEENGYSPAENSRELSAVIEGIILELYSSIDCTRTIIYSIFKNHSGIKNSTRRLFQSAFDDKIDERVPEFLRTTLKGANWYPGFLKIRDELTHSDVGSCHLNKETNKISYMHSGFQKNGKAFVIEDIYEKIEETFNDINTFQRKVYALFNAMLSEKEVWQMCGIFGGRIYSRFVIPNQTIDFNSGRCESYQWFEKEEKPTCPFVKTCGAYKNKKC